MIYTLTLNPALDYDVYLDELKNGELNISKEINLRAGGKGINVSIMLKNLGLESIALGYIAGFTGNFILEKLNEMDIRHDFIKTEGTTRINVKINDKEEETEIAGLSEKLNDNDVLKLKEQISKLTDKDILILSGSLANGLEKNIYHELSKITSAKVFLDTRGSLLLDNISNNVLIKPNIKELEEVFSESINDNKKLYDLASKFIEKGVENVLVSMGSNGAILVKKGKYLKANIPKGKYINSIGAGDSMVAGFAYAYHNHYNDIEALRLAVACGSSTAYSYGIGEKTLINELLKDIEIQEVIL